MEENYYCKICDSKITKWQHENNDDICTFYQEELDEDDNLVRETFGTFEERKEISDEELTRMTQEFLKRH